MPAASTPTSLAELAAALGREHRGDGGFRVVGLEPLETAGPHDLSFVRSATHAAAAAASGAGAFVAPAEVDCGARPVIVSPQPALDFARVVERLLPRPAPPRGVHPQALVAPDAKLDASASVGAGAVVGAAVQVGARTVVHANATLYPDVEVGADCEIHGGVVLREGTRVGDRVRLHPGVVIGGDGFGYVPDEHGDLHKVPQVGRVVIEDDVEIGANTTVDRATLAETRIRRGAKIDNLVQVAHNCDIGEGAVVVGQSGLSGGTIVGRRAALMAQVGSAGHLRVGDGAFVGARTGLHKDVADGGRVWGSPQMEERAWHRSVAALARLPEALRRLRAVERALGLRRGKPTRGSDPDS